MDKRVSEMLRNDIRNAISSGDSEKISFLYENKIKSIHLGEIDASRHVRKDMMYPNVLNNYDVLPDLYRR